MPTETPSSRSWFHHYKVEVAFLCFFVAAAVGGAFYVDHVEYLGGTKNVGYQGFIAAMQTFGVLSLIGLAFMIWTLVRFLRSPGGGKRTPAHLAFLTVSALILVAHFMVTGPLAATFLRGFEQWVLREVDTDAIQQWLATDGRNYAGRQYNGNLPEDLPDFLVRFKPRYVRFSDLASESGLHIEFGCGGGVSLWGFVVGLPDMPTPKEGAIDVSRSTVEFRRPIKPGVYVFDRG